MSATGDWTTKIKELRALVSRGPDSSPSSTTSTLSSTATTSPLSETKQKQNAGATKEKTTTAAAAAASSPSQPIRRLSHKQIDDLVRDTLEQSGLDTGDSHNARIASAVASAVARAVTTALNKAEEDSQSNEVDVLLRRNNDLEKRTLSVERQLSATEKEATRISAEYSATSAADSGMRIPRYNNNNNNNAQTLLTECERREELSSQGIPQGGSWPFDQTTKNVILALGDNAGGGGGGGVAAAPALPLNLLFGLHLKVGLQCREMKKEIDMMKKVTDHMKTESQQRQAEQQAQIDELKRRLVLSTNNTTSLSSPQATFRISPSSSSSSSSPPPATTSTTTTANEVSSSSSFATPSLNTSARTSRVSSTTATTTSKSQHRENLIKQKFKAAAYGSTGVNWKKLFHYYDKNNSGGLEFNELRR